MKILFFTPAIKLSAIGRMTRLVSLALISEGHEIVIIRTEAPQLLETRTHDFGAKILRWCDQELIDKEVASADGIVYQIGNHYDFHYGCLEWMVKQPGVVCLHDIYLGHLFYGWAQTRRAQAQRHVASWYGEHIANQFFAYQESESFLTGTSDLAPMTEWMCSMAHGVITHSSWGIKRVLDSSPGPVRVVPLAYDKPAYLTENRMKSEAAANKFMILTIGHVNPNKRAESVIKAIGNSPLLRTGATYCLVGSIQSKTAADLHKLATEQGVDLKICGEVDDTTLDQMINDADLISCLRWPSLEAASASAIEAMLYGKAVIVTHTGFYSELPDDVVRKIDHSNEVSELQAILERLYENTDERDQLGRRAQDWSSRTFTGVRYAQELVEMLIEVSAAKPVIEACNAFVAILLAWGASAEIVRSTETTSVLETLA